MSRKLSDLSPAFKPKAYEFLAKLVEAQIYVCIVDTLRTEAEQAANLKNGVSWTKNSRHLTGDAIDVCPWDQYQLNGGPDKLQWDTKDPVWRRIGAIAKGCGLIWGGDWAVRDFGHVELPR